MTSSPSRPFEQFGIDRLLNESELRAPLKNRRVALLAHPASVTSSLIHSVDALANLRELKLTAAFGPQHGMRGEKQDNMIETEDFIDPIHKIPVFSLYGKVRRPTPEMMNTFDVILVDLQDVGCRIYTFLTTLLYMLEACAEHKKSLWVLDRPNPAGRPIEGTLLKKGWESFVGAGPLPMRHGLTLGEAAGWFVKHFHLDVDFRVIKLKGYYPDSAPGFGWPLAERAWVNPSPNAGSVFMARAYPGTVMLEGTHLSEGRGTTKPLEVIGAPGLDLPALLSKMKAIAPTWLEGCALRPCYFEPTFHKHAGKLCNGFQFHVEGPEYSHAKFRPYRLMSLLFKAIRTVHPEFELWRSFAYEYETERLAIDLINGGPDLRTWVEDLHATADDFEQKLSADERAWQNTREPFLLY